MPDRKCQLNGEPDCKPECTKELCDHFLTDAEATESPAPSGQAELPGYVALTRDLLAMDRAISCLYLEVPQKIMDDVAIKWQAVRRHIRG